MPKDRAVGADGKPGTVDDVFTDEQLAALDSVIELQAEELLIEIQKDFAEVSNAIVFQTQNADADVQMSWKDLNGLYGMADYDTNVSKFRELVGTPGRTDPVTTNKYNLEIPESAQTVGAFHVHQ